MTPNFSQLFKTYNKTNWVSLQQDNKQNVQIFIWTFMTTKNICNPKKIKKKNVKTPRPTNEKQEREKYINDSPLNKTPIRQKILIRTLNKQSYKNPQQQ